MWDEIKLLGPIIAVVITGIAILITRLSRVEQSILDVKVTVADGFARISDTHKRIWDELKDHDRRLMAQASDLAWIKGKLNLMDHTTKEE